MLCYIVCAFCLLGIVYVRDTTRGGLCSYPVFNNGINGAFCRTEAGQTAAIIFLFVTMVVYLIGAIVCLKLWRHEAARRYAERHGQEVRVQPAMFLFLFFSALAPEISQSSELNCFCSKALPKIDTHCSDKPDNLDSCEHVESELYLHGAKPTVWKVVSVMHNKT